MLVKNAEWTIFFKHPISQRLPSRELTYPTWGSSDNHRLKMPFLGGYVSSLEGSQSQWVKPFGWFRSTQSQRSSHRPRYKNQVSWRLWVETLGVPPWWNSPWTGWPLGCPRLSLLGSMVGKWVIPTSYKIGIFLGVDKNPLIQSPLISALPRGHPSTRGTWGMGSQDEVGFSITMVNVYVSPKDRRATFWTP